MESFCYGRDFAAWLGLVPRQSSSGGQERLEAGQADIRRMLIVGAMSRLSWRSPKSIPWLARLLARKSRMLVAIALTNKVAQTLWAMLVRGQDYQDPASAAVA